LAPTTRTTCSRAAWCRARAADAGDDTPDQRPERDEPRKTKTRAPSQSNKVIEGTSTEVKPDGSGSVSDTVQAKPEEPAERHPNAPAPDEEPKTATQSTELINGLGC